MFSGIVAVVGMCGLFGGGLLVLFFVARRALIVPIMLLEDVGLKAALKRNKQLMGAAKYHPDGAGTIWLLYFVNFITGSAVAAGVAAGMEIAGVRSFVQGWTQGLGSQPLFLAAENLLPFFFTTWLLLPFWGVVVTVMYYERRVRVEGFDIEQLNEEIGREGRTSRFNV
jgi:hypothetical protein